MRTRTRGMVFVGIVLSWVVAGCAPLSGDGTPTTIPTTHMATMTLQLGDLPDGFQLAVDSTPDDTSLAQQLAAPTRVGTLRQLGRRGGTYRAFIYALTEPSTINGPTQATVEVDIFDTQTHAQDWLVARQADLAATAGAAIAVGVPGQQHFTRMQVQHGEAVTLTASVTAFTEHNVYVEITSDLLGPGPSLAENERYAALIDSRILEG